MKFDHCQAVLFDLDGTLLDTAPDFVTALNRLLTECGRDTLAPEVIRAGVTHGSGGLITLGFGLNANDDEFEPVRQRLLTHYLNCLTEQTDMFPGMDKVLLELEARTMPWGIVTNKPELYTQAILESLTFPSPPATVICPDHVSRTKPDPEPIHLACQQLGIAADRTIYVGDHQRDIEAGNNAGSRTIAAAYGYIDEGEDPFSWGADHVVETVEQLRELLF
jgi:phosphoglycolate phosphatase